MITLAAVEVPEVVKEEVDGFVVNLRSSDKRKGVDILDGIEEC